MVSKEQGCEVTSIGWKSRRLTPCRSQKSTAELDLPSDLHYPEATNQKGLVRSEGTVSSLMYDGAGPHIPVANETEALPAGYNALKKSN